MKKILHLIAALLMAVTLVAAMTACGGNGNGNGTGNGNGNGTGNGNGNTGEGGDTKVEYTVSVKTIGGRPVSKLTFLVYDGTNLVTYGQTDENGVGKISAAVSTAWQAAT